MNTVELQNVNKFYGDFKAVRDISLTIKKGQMFGLLGPNGAGKTTTMRMMMNIIVPDSGRITLFGQPFQESHKNMIGYLPEERGLYPKMTVLDHLRFLGEMKGLSAGEARRIAEQWLQKFELADRSKKKINELSKGLQQKVQFIGTILHSPQLLIVDEPFSGLDPVNTMFLKDILLTLKSEGCTIILSTHLMDQAEKLCEEICLLNAGQIVLQGPIKQVKESYGHNSIILDYSGEAAFIGQLPMVKTINDYGNYMDIQLNDSARPAELFRALADSDLQITRFEAAETSLNDIFIEQIGGGSHAKNN